MQASHAELAKEQQKSRELERMLNSYKKLITELQDEVEQLTKQNGVTCEKVLDIDSLVPIFVFADIIL